MAVYADMLTGLMIGSALGGVAVVSWIALRLRESVRNRLSDAGWRM
jgi:hypothetical protein